MFTGLVQSIGKIRRRGKRVLVEGCEILSPICIGDSISVDGVCLTVAENSLDGFLSDISEETLTRTTLGDKSEKGGYVNLEPALRLSDRLGGHLVSGHVDGMGKVVSIEELEHSWQVGLRWDDPFYGRYICEKASIAIDGASLTIARCSHEGTRFSVAVIPHTWANTSLKYLRPGLKVNLEVDLMAKYAESLLKKVNLNSDSALASKENMTSEWLADHGWT